MWDGGQHTRDTIRLVPLHLMLLSWMQNAEKERLFEKNNKLQTEKWASFKKIVFRSKKLLFQPFFLNCKNENGFLKQRFSNWQNKLLHKTIESGCFKKAFSFCSWRKKAEKENFWSEILFFGVFLIYLYWREIDACLGFFYYFRHLVSSGY